MNNPTISAGRQQLREIVLVAQALDRDLASVERYEQAGERVLTCLTAARLLCELSRVNEALIETQDQLSEQIADLPPLRGPHDGAAKVEGR
jgi:hypothetical protein